MRWLTVLVLVAGCGLRPGADRSASRELLTSWSRAVERDDPRAAYALLSTPLKRSMPFDRFEAAWKDSKRERVAQRAALAHRLSDVNVLEESAQVTMADGMTLALVRDVDGWRLSQPLLTARGAAAPKDALDTLALGLEERNYAAVARSLSRCSREIYEEAVRKFTEGLRRHATDAIEVSGNRAVLTWKDASGRYQVRLVREDGEWHIEDVVVPRLDMPPSCGDGR